MFVQNKVRDDGAHDGEPAIAPEKKWNQKNFDNKSLFSFFDALR